MTAQGKKTNRVQALLIAQSGPLNGERWVLKDITVIGRDPGCSIVLVDRQVSRYHARVSIEGERVALEDLGSKNGTFLDNVQLTEPVMLHDGDIFSVALIQQFVYLSSDATLPLDLPVRVSKEKWGKLFVDTRSRRIWLGDKELDPPLSVPQFRLLQEVYNRPGQVVARQELEVAVWGDEGAVGISDQALDALIRRLRDRLAEIDPVHQYLVTIRGHGIRFENAQKEDSG